MINKWSPAVGALGLAALISGLLGYYLRSAWSPFEYVALAAGGACLLAFAVLNFREIAEALTQRGALQTGNAVLMALLVLAILVLVNFLAHKHSKRFDTTAARQFSLSDQTLSVLHALRDELHVTAFYLPQEQDRARDALEEYAAVTPKFQYEFIDPDKKPEAVRQWGVTTYGTMVVSYHGNHEKINSEGEAALTNAIVKVTRAQKKKIYFTTQHGEKSLDDGERLGLSAAQAVIQEKNYDTAPVSLLKAW